MAGMGSQVLTGMSTERTEAKSEVTGAIMMVSVAPPGPKVSWHASFCEVR